MTAQRAQLVGAAVFAHAFGQPHRPRSTLHSATGRAPRALMTSVEPPPTSMTSDRACGRLVAKHAQADQARLVAARQDLQRQTELVAARAPAPRPGCAPRAARWSRRHAPRRRARGRSSRTAPAPSAADRRPRARCCRCQTPPRPGARRSRCSHTTSSEPSGRGRASFMRTEFVPTSIAASVGVRSMLSTLVTDAAAGRRGRGVHRTFTRRQGKAQARRGLPRAIPGANALHFARCPPGPCASTPPRCARCCA